MGWLWRRPGAERQDRAADERLRRAEALAAEARIARAKVRRELNKNGFTELFQQAMERR
jgi:hypothetical protein